MGSINTLDAYIEKMTGGNNGNPEHLYNSFAFRTDGAAANPLPTAGIIYNTWGISKQILGAGSAIGSLAVPAKNSPGAVFHHTNPGGGRQKFLLGIDATIANNSTNKYICILYDRLMHIGGLSGSSTSAQTVDAGGNTMNRYNGATDCIGNQIWAFIQTAVGTTATTLTCSYKDQDGNTKTTKPALFGGSGGERNAGSILPLPLADDGLGVRGLFSGTLAASTLGVGDWGLMVVRPLALWNTEVQHVATCQDLLVGMPSMPEIKTDACLCLAIVAPVNAATGIMFGIHTVEA